jgi:hypothetical protein
MSLEFDNENIWLKMERNQENILLIRLYCLRSGQAGDFSWATVIKIVLLD